MQEYIQNPSVSSVCFPLDCRGGMERATSTCGPQGMAAPTTTVTVTGMPPVCGLSPLILPPTTDRRPDMTNPAPLLSPPRSVTAKAPWEMPGWYVRHLISFTAKFPVLYWLSISINFYLSFTVRFMISFFRQRPICTTTVPQLTQVHQQLHRKPLGYLRWRWRPSKSKPRSR